MVVTVLILLVRLLRLADGNTNLATIEYIVKKIKVSSHIKLAISITIILAFIATITYCIYQHNVYRIMQNQEVVISEEIIQED